jgi:hypothetical protein
MLKYKSRMRTARSSCQESCQSQTKPTPNKLVIRSKAKDPLFSDANKATKSTFLCEHQLPKLKRTKKQTEGGYGFNRRTKSTQEKGPSKAAKKLQAEGFVTRGRLQPLPCRVIRGSRKFDLVPQPL